jgi:DnaJ-class molecular chaperone
MSSYYGILGISKDATETEIKKAFRSLSLKYHPDRNPDPSVSDKIREINSAYDCLSDTERRQTYDAEQRFGSAFPPNMQSSSGHDEINNLFNMLFGASGGGGIPGMNPNIRMFNGMEGLSHPLFRQPSRGQFHSKPPPITIKLSISLEQSYTGCTLPIEIQRDVFVGDTKIQEEETLYVSIQPGSDDNEIIELSEKGHVTSDQEKGNVKVILHVENNTPFQRKGIDLFYKQKLTLKEALCGFSIELHHISGKKMLLANNNSNNTIVKPNFKNVVPNSGMKRGNVTGKLIIEFDIQFPDKLDNTQLDTLRNIL